MIVTKIIQAVAIAALTVAFSLGIYDLFQDLKKHFLNTHMNAIYSDIIYLVIISTLLILIILLTRNSPTTLKYLQKNI